MPNQPAVRLDYQPWQQLRGTFKFSGWPQKNTTVNGTIPGFNDTRQYKPVLRTMAVTINVGTSASTASTRWNQSTSTV